MKMLIGIGSAAAISVSSMHRLFNDEASSTESGKILKNLELPYASSLRKRDIGNVINGKNTSSNSETSDFEKLFFKDKMV